jgi:hypothetical protein
MLQDMLEESLPNNGECKSSPLGRWFQDYIGTKPLRYLGVTQLLLIIEPLYSVVVCVVRIIETP